MLGVNERMDVKLFGREIIFEEFQPTVCHHDDLNVTADRQTDGRTDDLLSHHRALC